MVLVALERELPRHFQLLDRLGRRVTECRDAAELGAYGDVHFVLVAPAHHRAKLRHCPLLSVLRLRPATGEPGSSWPSRSLLVGSSTSGGSLHASTLGCFPPGGPGRIRSIQRDSRAP